METATGVVPEGSDHSAQLGEIAIALAKAQGAMRGAEKDALNPHFKTKYADLASCWDAARKPLADNGLAVVQMTDSGPDGIGVISMLIHGSGQWFRTRVWMPLDKPTPQTIGSAITYGRRYGLCALVGVAPDDDDGEAAQRGPGPAKAPAAPPTPQPPARRTAVQAAQEIDARLRAASDRATLDRIWSDVETMPFAPVMKSQLRRVYDELVGKSA